MATGKIDTDKFNVMVGCGNLKVDEDVCQHIYRLLCILGMLKCSRLMKHFNLNH